MTAEGVLIRPVARRLNLAERLAADVPMEGEPTEALAWEASGAEAPAAEKSPNATGSEPSA